MSTAISQIHILPLIQPPLTLAIAKGLSYIPAEMVAETALGIYVASLILGYLYEVDTLKKLGLTSNPLTVLTYFKIRNPEIATAIGDFLGQVIHSFNPIDITYTTLSLASNDGGHLFFSNLISRSVLGYGFVTGFNWALRQGHADKIVARIHDLRQQAADKLTEFELAICPLPESIDYLDNTSGDFRAWRPETGRQSISTSASILLK